VEGELNYIFTGCYSSQSRIKQANRIAEDSLQTAEALTALAALAAGGKQYPGYRVAWQETLFNQFHDILPGSGVRQTRECALGKLEEILGYTYAGRTKALTALAARIDTSDIATEFDRESFADGAGMGYKGQCEHNSSLVPGFEPEICDRGCGKTRILNVFNPTAYARSQAYDFSLWDWPGDIERLRITDSDSQEIPFSVAGEPEKYWAHTCVRLTAFVTVPAYGYITLRITEGERRKAASPFPTGQHLTETFAPLQLENEKLRAQFDAKMQLASLLDKKTGRELISGPSGFFSLCRQNQKSKANAWVEGYSVKEDNLNEICPVFVTEANAAELRREVSYQLSYGKSTLKVTVALEKDSSVLQYKIAADWHELFSEELGIPALKFNLPFSYGVEGYTYGIPFGAIRRQALAHDVPAIGFGAAADPQSGRSLLLMTDSVYAYRGEGNALRLTLLRATQEPDLYPEVGLHDYRLGVGICEADEYYKFSDCFNYPLSCITNTAHGGELPQKDSLLAVSDNLAVSALKVTEDESGVIIRLFDATGQGGRGWIRLKADVAAETVDLLEQPCPGKLTVEDGRLAFDLRANEIISLKLRRKE
jgi:alpha-mannosidase